jgi:hypothetical protein
VWTDWTEPNVIIGFALMFSAAIYFVGLERGRLLERARHPWPPNVDDWAAGWWASGGSLAAGKWAAESMGPDCGL